MTAPHLQHCPLIFVQRIEPGVCSALAACRLNEIELDKKEECLQLGRPLACVDCDTKKAQMSIPSASVSVLANVMPRKRRCPSLLHWPQSLQMQPRSDQSTLEVGSDRAQVCAVIGLTGTIQEELLSLPIPTCSMSSQAARRLSDFQEQARLHTSLQPFAPEPAFESPLLITKSYSRLTTGGAQPGLPRTSTFKSHRQHSKEA